MKFYRVGIMIKKKRLKIEDMMFVLLFFSANTGITSGNMDQFKTRVILSSDGTNTW